MTVLHDQLCCCTPCMMDPSGWHGCGRCTETAPGWAVGLCVLALITQKTQKKETGLGSLFCFSAKWSCDFDSIRSPNQGPNWE
jgi:hypothetical protein